jgi:membrane-bound metal-dependent hydrolase YbcI (DUF457 family)
MALPVAHGLVGATVAALLIPERHEGRRLRTILAAAIFAISPDLDYVLYRGLEWGEAWHRTFSHSILFALVAGGVAWLLVGPRSPRFFVIYSLAVVSHPLLDALVSQEGGVQFLWPLSDRMFRFGLIAYPNAFAGNPGIHTVIARIVEYSFVEMMVFAPILIFVLWLKSRTHQKTA